MRTLFNAVVMYEGSGYVAKCPENSVSSQGKTIEEALDNLKVALALFYEDERPPTSSTHALLTTVEVELR